MVVTDALGNSTQLVNELFGLIVPGITYHRLGDESHLVIMPTDQAYSVTMSSGTTPMSIDISVGDGNTPTQAIRYHDVVLPEGTMSIVRLSPAGIEDLRYDSDGNGSFDTPIVPTASVSGTAAADVEPPIITITSTVQVTTAVVTLVAADTGSGVHSLLYSLDGTSFYSYTNTLQLDMNQAPILYAFAQDNIANRSSLFEYPLAAYGVTVSPDLAARSGAPGSQVEYSLHATNTGNISDTYTVTHSGNTWATMVPGTVGPLVAGASTAVPVTVTIPADAGSSATDTKPQPLC